jgi:hypothetical protein
VKTHSRIACCPTIVEIAITRPIVAVLPVAVELTVPVAITVIAVPTTIAVAVCITITLAAIGVAFATISLGATFRAYIGFDPAGIRAGPAGRTGTPLFLCDGE